MKQDYSNDSTNRYYKGGCKLNKKTGQNTKSKIVSAAWKLFYDNGYEATTIDEIIKESQTSKGSFYHYFENKDALIGSLAYLFDEKYEALAKRISPDQNAVETLLFLNRELFDMIENTIDLELVKRLYATQLLTKSQKQLVDHNRVYYKLLRKIIVDGQKNGSITEAQSVNEIVKYYAFCERAMIYDWCLCNGDYSLKNAAKDLLPFLLKKIEK